MADNIVAGLFGLDPYQIQQQRQAQIDAQAAQYAQMQPLERAAAGMYKAGAGLGQVGAGMLGMVDPLEQKARTQQAAMQGADLTTPEGLKAAALRFNQLGMPQQAMIAAMQARKMEDEEAERALKLAHAEYYKKGGTTGGVSQLSAKQAIVYNNTYGKFIDLNYTPEQAHQLALQAAERVGAFFGKTPETPISDTSGIAPTTKAQAQGAIELEKTRAQNEPSILAAGARAKEVGKGAGEAETSLSIAESTYPQLDKTVEELKDIAKEATYTYTGQGRDIVARQLGYATKGAVAREKYMQTVRDVLFPQLRATFGAQFTAKEGEALISTMGDPNKTPEERVAALEAFIDQKKQTIESLRRQTGKRSNAEPQGKKSNIRTADDFLKSKGIK